MKKKLIITGLHAYIACACIRPAPTRRGALPGASLFLAALLLAARGADVVHGKRTWSAPCERPPLGCDRGLLQSGA
eukprot:scaffold8278_cov124-Isochrysis_galbana.AAC.1